MLTNLPTVPDGAAINYNFIVSFAAISAPQHTFSYTLIGLPINYVVCGVCIRLVDKFTGSSLSSLTCSLGAFVPNTILTDITYYCLNEELTQLPSVQTFQTSGPASNDLTQLTNPYSPATGLYYNGPHDIAAYFTSVGTNLNNLTAGTVEISIQIRPF